MHVEVVVGRRLEVCTTFLHIITLIIQLFHSLN